MKASHSAWVKPRNGPSGSLESRTRTAPSAAKTSTQLLPPLPLLKLDFRHFGLAGPWMKLAKPLKSAIPDLRSATLLHRGLCFECVEYLSTTLVTHRGRSELLLALLHPKRIRDRTVRTNLDDPA